MKTFTYLLTVFCLAVSSCKKPTGKQITPPGNIHFVITGKDGKNMIHSVEDNLTATYIVDGVTKTVRLHIYKVQVSAIDTTTVSKYNGFVVSDRDYASANIGYIAAASSIGARSFNLYLNSVNIGVVYLDYRGLPIYTQEHPYSSTFTFNGVPVTYDYIIGVYNNGDGIASEIEHNTAPPGGFVYLLHKQ